MSKQKFSTIDHPQVDLDDFVRKNEQEFNYTTYSDIRDKYLAFYKQLQNQMQKVTQFGSNKKAQLERYYLTIIIMIDAIKAKQQILQFAPQTSEQIAKSFTEPIKLLIMCMDTLQYIKNGRVWLWAQKSSFWAKMFSQINSQDKTAYFYMMDGQPHTNSKQKFQQFNTPILIKIESIMLFLMKMIGVEYKGTQTRMPNHLQYITNYNIFKLFIAKLSQINFQVEALEVFSLAKDAIVNDYRQVIRLSLYSCMSYIIIKSTVLQSWRSIITKRAENSHKKIPSTDIKDQYKKIIQNPTLNRLMLNIKKMNFVWSLVKYNRDPKALHKIESFGLQKVQNKLLSLQEMYAQLKISQGLKKNIAQTFDAEKIKQFKADIQQAAYLHNKLEGLYGQYTKGSQVYGKQLKRVFHELDMKYMWMSKLPDKGFFQSSQFVLNFLQQILAQKQSIRVKPSHDLRSELSIELYHRLYPKLRFQQLSFLIFGQISTQKWIGLRSWSIYVTLCEKMNQSQEIRLCDLDEQLFYTDYDLSIGQKEFQLIESSYLASRINSFVQMKKLYPHIMAMVFQSRLSIQKFYSQYGSKSQHSIVEIILETLKSGHQFNIADEKVERQLQSLMVRIPQSRIKNRQSFKAGKFHQASQVFKDYGEFVVDQSDLLVMKNLKQFIQATRQKQKQLQQRKTAAQQRLYDVSNQSSDLKNRLEGFLQQINLLQQNNQKLKQQLQNKYVDMNMKPQQFERRGAEKRQTEYLLKNFDYKNIFSEKQIPIIKLFMQTLSDLHPDQAAAQLKKVFQLAQKKVGLINIDAEIMKISEKYRNTIFLRQTEKDNIDSLIDFMYSQFRTYDIQECYRYLDVKENMYEKQIKYTQQAQKDTTRSPYQSAILFAEKSKLKRALVQITNKKKALVGIIRDFLSAAWFGQKQISRNFQQLRNQSKFIRQLTAQTTQLKVVSLDKDFAVNFADKLKKWRQQNLPSLTQSNLVQLAAGNSIKSFLLEFKDYLKQKNIYAPNDFQIAKNAIIYTKTAINNLLSQNNQIKKFKNLSKCMFQQHKKQRTHAMTIINTSNNILTAFGKKAIKAIGSTQMIHKYSNFYEKLQKLISKFKLQGNDYTKCWNDAHMVHTIQQFQAGIRNIWGEDDETSLSIMREIKQNWVKV